MPVPWQSQSVQNWELEDEVWYQWGLDLAPPPPGPEPPPTYPSSDWTGHPDVLRTLRMFPEFMQNSRVIDRMARIITIETFFRMRDIVDTIQRNHHVFHLDDFGIEIWERELGLGASESQTFQQRLAAVVARRLRKAGMRRYDMARIAQQFMSGSERAYVVEQSTGTTMRVNDTSIFHPGLVVYLGDVALTIITVNHEEARITVDLSVTVQPYDVLSTTVTAVYEEPPDFNFFIAIEKTLITDLPGIIREMQGAKPAHMKFQIIDWPPMNYNEPTVTYSQAGVWYPGTEILHTEEIP